MAGNSGFGSELVAALVGALVGGGISGLLQWQSFQIQRTIRRQERTQADLRAEEETKEREALLAFSIGVKLVRVLSALQQVREHLDSALIEVLRTHMDFAAATRPFSSDFDRVSFSLDELAFVKALAKDDLVNQMINLPAIMDLYVDNLAVFRSVKAATMELADTVTLNNKGLASSMFSNRNAYFAKLRMAEANVLLVHLLGRAIVDYPMAHNLLRNFQTAVLDRLGRERVQFVWTVPDTPVFRRPKGT